MQRTNTEGKPERVAPQHPTNAWALAFGGLLALASVMGIGRFLYTPILPMMVADLGLSKGEAGLIASANFLGYLAGAILTSAPRIPGSPRLWLVGALSLSAATTFAMGMTETMWVFLLLRFLGGAASAFTLVFASTLIMERLAASGHGHLVSIIFAGVGFGILVSALFSAALGGTDANWHLLWFIGGILSLVAVITVPGLVPARPAAPASAPAPVSSRAKSRLWTLAIAYGLFGFGYVITATFIVSMVRTSPDVTLAEPSVWFAVGLAGIPSVALWNALARRTGAIRAFALANLVEAVGVFASVIWPNNAGILIAAVLLGGTFMSVAALGLMAGRELAGAKARQVLGLLTVAFAVGQMMGPAIAGYAFDWTGSFMVPSLIATAALVAAAALTMRLSDA